jgi:hypothetical protein
LSNPGHRRASTSSDLTPTLPPPRFLPLHDESHHRSVLLKLEPPLMPPLSCGVVGAPRAVVGCRGSSPLLECHRLSATELPHRRRPPTSELHSLWPCPMPPSGHIGAPCKDHILSLPPASPQRPCNREHAVHGDYGWAHARRCTRWPTGPGRQAEARSAFEPAMRGRPPRRVVWGPTLCGFKFRFWFVESTEIVPNFENS